MTPSAATGKVTFYDGVTVLETEPVMSGKAVFTTTLLQSGARILKAYYAGDSNDAASTSAVLTEQVTTIAGDQFQASSAYPVGVANAEGAPLAVGDLTMTGELTWLPQATCSLGTAMALFNHPFCRQRYQ